MMNISQIIKSTICVAMAALMVCSAASCGKKKNVTSATAPTFGHFTSKGYELPYDYKDGYRATMKVPTGCEYMNVTTTPGGNKVVYMTSPLSVDEVNKFYDKYFKELVKLKAVKKTDKSVAYFDEAARLILFNLNVWTADGKTTFSIGTQACDKLEDATLWEKAENKKSKNSKTESSKTENGKTENGKTESKNTETTVKK